MTTTGHEATTHNALRGTEVVMARSFYVVEWLFADGSLALSRTFATKRAASKFAAAFRTSNWTRARVLEGGAGGMEVARFTR